MHFHHARLGLYETSPCAGQRNRKNRRGAVSGISIRRRIESRSCVKPSVLTFGSRSGETPAPTPAGRRSTESREPRRTGAGDCLAQGRLGVACSAPPEFTLGLFRRHEDRAERAWTQSDKAGAAGTRRWTPAAAPITAPGRRTVRQPSA